MLRRTMLLPFLLVCVTLVTVSSQQHGLQSSTIFGDIENVASSATNFLSGVIQRQKAFLHRMTDVTSNYIANAVERPKNLLLNATRVTTGIIDSAASKGLEFKLRRVLDKFRYRMPYGIPELGIPPLEPLTLDEITIDTNNPEIGNIYLVIQDLVVRKLSTYSIDRAKLSLIGPTITVNLTIPDVYATGFYNISGVLGDLFTLGDAGQFEANLYNFHLYVNIVLGFSKGVYMRSFNLDFTLEAADIRLDNFVSDEEVASVMNKVLRELTPQLVEVIKPDILPGIQDYIASKANETMQHLTLRDLLSLLLGESDATIREIAHMIVP